MSTAAADVWIVHDRVLERRDVDGEIVTTVSAPFGAPIGAIVDDGDIDPTTGNVWIASRELDEIGPQRTVRVLGVKPSGEGLWERAETGALFIEPSIAIDPSRQGVWVLRAVDPESSPAWEAVLFDQNTGDARATIRGLTGAVTVAVGADGALRIDANGDWIRLEGSIEDLDGYEVVGSTGPHHRTFEPDPEGEAVAVNRSDGSLYFVDQVSDPTQDILESYLVGFSADGAQLFRVRHGARTLWESITDIAIDTRDGSVYVSEGAALNFNGSVSHVSPTGAELASAEYREHVNSITVDAEDSGVWIGHMPVVDDDEAFVAPMILRKLDSSLETELSVAFDSVVTVIGTAPAALEISLDIEPQDKRNVVNLIPKNGEVRVALLSSTAFDALQVDLETVRFGTAGAVVRSHWTRDVNRDSHADLVVTFKTQHTGIKCGDTAAPLTAETHAGVAVHGTDFLRTKCSPSGASFVLRER
jgi:PAS domain-containing protein